MARTKITHERRHIGLRLEILDELLNSNKRRSYKELLKALNEKLASNDEITISERTLKYDISYLIDQKFAPVHRPDKKDPYIYYTEKFSLKNIPLDDDDISSMKKAVAILKKATDIKLNAELDAIITRLENKIHTNIPDSKTIIAFEEHTQAKGKEYFDEIFSAIHEHSALKIIYQPFGKDEREWTIHPYMLKEFRNRWFVFARVNSNNYLSTLSLDRLKGKIKNSPADFIENDLFDPDTYFNNLVGVSFPEDQTQPQNIFIKVYPELVQYIKTKPLHKNQTIIKEHKDGSIEICTCLFINYELKSLLLSHGAGIEVMQPALLREEMKCILEKTFKLYKKFTG